MANKKLPDVYFKGKASLKYCSENINSSEQKGHASFEFSNFYDVVIDELIEIDYFTFKDASDTIRAKNKLDYALVNLRGEYYKVEVRDFVLLEIPKINHEQLLNNELLGEINQVNVYVRIPSQTTKQENLSTGNRKTEDGVIYEEFYTNEGKLEWRIIKAVRGKLTGRVQKRDDLFRYEHFNSDGTTYWSSWVERKNFVVPKNIKTGPTGLKKLGKKQILTEDHKFKWVKDDSPRESSIVINLFVLGIMLLFSTFIYYISFQYEGEVVVKVILPIMSGFFILVPAINLLLKLMNKSKRYIVQYNWLILTILCTGLTLLLFSTSMVGAINEFCKNRRYKDFLSENQQLHFSQKQESCVFQQKWINYHDKTRPQFSVIISTNCEVFCDCEEGFNTENLFSRYFHTIQKADKYWGKEKKEVIRQIKQQNGLYKSNELDFLNTIFSMIQSRPYAKSHEKNLVKDFVSPVHFLFGLNENDVANFTGDCDTRTLALFFLLKDQEDDIDVAIFNYNSPDPKRFPNHSMIGISSNKFKVESKKFKTINGKRYYLWETTAKYKLGRTAPQYSNLSRWNLILSEDDFN